MARKIFKDKPTPPVQGKDGRIRRGGIGQSQGESGRFIGSTKSKHDPVVNKALSSGHARLISAPSRQAIKTLASSSLSQLGIVDRDSAFYPKEIFDSKAEYDASVDSVVARIKSGAVKARTPDE